MKITITTRVGEDITFYSENKVLVSVMLEDQLEITKENYNPEIVMADDINNVVMHFENPLSSQCKKLRVELPKDNQFTIEDL